MNCKEIFDVSELVKNKHEILYKVTNHKPAPLLLFLDFKQF